MSILSLQTSLEPLSAGQRLALLAEEKGRIVFTTSFGLEDQALTHMIAERNLPIAIVTLDTGRLFSQTYDLWAETEARYGIRITGYVPEAKALEALVQRDGINGFRQAVVARKACCGIRKLELLARALSGASIWITGLRAEQSAFRSATPLVEEDRERKLIKVNPLKEWTRERLVDFIALERVPYNPLHDQGFASIGCAPCTRAIKLGEPERAGRWWWEEDSKRECGLHAHGANPTNGEVA